MPAAPAGQAPAIGWRALAWVFAPPLCVLLLRSALKEMAGADDGLLQPLRPAVLVDSAGQALWVASRPLLLTLLGGAAAAWAARKALRRWGWARLGPWAAALWALLWLGGGAWLLAAHLNRTGRQPQPPQTATVLLAGEVRPSARSPGGAELYLQWPGQPQPQRLFVPEQPASAFARGVRVPVQAHTGRWWGRWATLSAPPITAPMTAPAPAAPPAAAGGPLTDKP